MHCIYIPRKINGNTIAISDAEQLHHLKEVSRLRVNDEVNVFDSEGHEYLCLITAMDKKQALLAVKAKKFPESRKIKLTIACAIPKKARMDEIIDKLTQLGVDTIVPMETERVIVKLDNSKKETRINRWRKIAQSAAEQSQRNRVPRVEPITDIETVLSHSGDFDLNLISTLCGETKPVKDVLAESKASNILVLIGPEGDFAPQEVELAKHAGFVAISLGAFILRVDTAAIAIASYINFSLNG